MCRSINILRNVLVLTSHCIKQYLQNDKSSCHFTPLYALPIEVDLSLFKQIPPLVSLHKSLPIMASKLSNYNNRKCLLVWFAQNTGLKPNCWTNNAKFRILWFSIVALCEHSEHKLTRFNFVKHNGCIDNAGGTIRGLGHIEDYWGLGCGAFVADSCWNLFKASGIGIVAQLDYNPENREI